MVLIKFSAISSVNNYIKVFYENNISFETQYDLQYINVEIMEASKNGILDILRCKHKTSYNMSYKTKQIKKEAFALSKKYENHLYYQQNKAKLQDVRKLYYLENKNDTKKQKKAYYSTNFNLIHEKNSNYYYGNIDFVRE